MKIKKIPVILIFVALFAIPALGQTSSDKSDLRRYEAAAKYSGEHRGVAVVVMKGDKIVFEDYASPFGEDVPWILASGTKSFSGVMCAAAIEDKLISGFDEKVADTITEWQTDKWKSKITIRQLLSLTSGLYAGEIAVVPAYSEAIKSNANYEPGTHFEYGPVPFQVFGEVMRRKLKARNDTVDCYIKRRILDPLGIDVALWRKSDGQPLLPQGVALTGREWIKFGRFLKDRGKWNGKQIISEKLLAELTVGSKVNPAYGITFWLNADGTGPSGSNRKSLSGDVGAKKMSDKLDVFMAAGAGNQRLYIIPSKDMAVVRFGAFGDYDDREFLNRLFDEK